MVPKTPVISNRNGVYPPREDSYLLMDNIAVNDDNIFLDMGTGTGIVAISVKLKNPNCQVWAVDINQDAVTLTQENAIENSVQIFVSKSDLFVNIPKVQKFDIIAFNPPYLPSNEIDKILDDTEIWQWTGGCTGVEVSLRFLDQALNHLNKNGRIYLIASSLAKCTKLDEFAKAKSLNCIIIKQESFFFEKLFLLEFTHLSV